MLIGNAQTEGAAAAISFDAPCDVETAQRLVELGERHHTHAGPRAGSDGGAMRELAGDDDGGNARNLRAMTLPCHEVPRSADDASIGTDPLDPDVHSADVAAEAVEDSSRKQQGSREPFGPADDADADQR